MVLSTIKQILYLLYVLAVQSGAGQFDTFISKLLASLTLYECEACAETMPLHIQSYRYTHSGFNTDHGTNRITENSIKNRVFVQLP